MRAFLLVLSAMLAGLPAFAGDGGVPLLTLAFSANTYGYVKPCPS